MKIMKGQNIHLENWDNLIILDACRFDFFKKVYRDYLDGKLEKRISNGSNTGEWLVKTFPNKYDYTYISANPYINSCGIPLNKCQLEYRNYSWNAIEHFSKIIDVWEFGWNEELGTIHPREIDKAFLSNKENRKTIVHYMQPHYPYLSYGGVLNLRNKIKRIKDITLDYKQILRNILSLYIKSFYPRGELTILERLKQKIGIEKLVYYYEDNLRIVLRNVSQLMDDLNGTTIITADHGEAFGEQGIWEHPVETHIPVLIEVPWLELISS